MVVLAGSVSVGCTQQWELELVAIYPLTGYINILDTEYIDKADLTAGALSRIPTQRVPRSTHTVICLVATWTADRLTQYI